MFTCGEGSKGASFSEHPAVAKRPSLGFPIPQLGETRRGVRRASSREKFYQCGRG